jgi:hypothetical protein
MNQDFLDLLGALSDAEARFLIVKQIAGLEFAAAWPRRVAGPPQGRPF